MKSYYETDMEQYAEDITTLYMACGMLLAMTVAVFLGVVIAVIWII